MEKLGQPEHPLKLLARRASKMHHPFFFRSPKKRKKKNKSHREREREIDGDGVPWKGMPEMEQSEQWSLDTGHFLGKKTTTHILHYAGGASIDFFCGGGEKKTNL